LTDDATTPGGTSPLAIVAFVVAFLLPLAAIVIGHVALHRIHHSGEGGVGLARAGTILGYVFTIVGGALVVVYFGQLLAQAGL
jgi:hypothetical protein